MRWKCSKCLAIVSEPHWGLRTQPPHSLHSAGHTMLVPCQRSHIIWGFCCHSRKCLNSPYRLILSIKSLTGMPNARGPGCRTLVYKRLFGAVEHVKRNALTCSKLVRQTDTLYTYVECVDIRWPEIYKIWSEIWGCPQQKGGPKALEFWTNFEQFREYLPSETRHHRTENGVANCNLSCAI